MSVGQSEMWDATNADVGLSEHEADVERLRAACRHVVANCYCQPSGQTCDVCGPAMLALAERVPDA